MTAENNPILEDGFIRFSDIKPQHYEEAFEAGLKEQDENIAAITSSKEKPTFEKKVKDIKAEL